MLVSMTGYAAQSGSADGFSWSWDLRSVNGKGLDLRMRLPDWLSELEADLRKASSARLGRGNVTIGLRIAREAGETGSEVNPEALDRVLDAIAQIEDRAAARGITLTPASAATVLGHRGVMDAPQRSEASDTLLSALRADIAPLFEAFCAMRASEGAALQEVLTRQLDEITALTDQAHALLPARAEQMRAGLSAALSRVLEARADLDETRLAQEIAALAVKSDVTEEIDRLRAHIAAAQELLEATGPVGRKFDFLMQEFNREANTLCSKAQNAGLTEIGLALKVLIDQMREQVQNVE